MHNSDNDNSISVEKGRVLFTGTIKSIDASMIEVLRKKLIYEPGLILDFTFLNDLKAKGVTALAGVIDKSPHLVTIKINDAYSWQKATISAFHILKPDGIKII